MRSRLGASVFSLVRIHGSIPFPLPMGMNFGRVARGFRDERGDGPKSDGVNFPRENRLSGVSDIGLMTGWTGDG